MRDDLKGYAKAEVFVDPSSQELTVSFSNGSGFSMSVDSWWKELAVSCWVEGNTPECKRFDWHMSARNARIFGGRDVLQIENDRRRFELRNGHGRLLFCLYDYPDSAAPDFKLELGDVSLLLDEKHLKQFQEFLDGCHPVRS